MSQRKSRSLTDSLSFYISEIYKSYFTLKTSKNLETELEDAVRNNNVFLAENLIRKGAILTRKPGKKNLLDLAVENENVAMAKLLINNGVDSNLRNDKKNMWLWHNIFAA